MEEVYIRLLEANVIKTITDPLPCSLLVGRERVALAPRLVARKCFFMDEPGVCAWYLIDHTYYQWHP